MTAQVTQSVSNGALTTPTPLTPQAADTISRDQFGPNGVMLIITTTGTATTLTVADPTPTGMGNAGTLPSQTCPSTGVRFAFVPLAAINTASNNATLNFSGALTGVTYNAIRV